MSHKLIFISYYFLSSTLTLSWRRPLSYRNQSIDIWFLYDNGPRHERVKYNTVQYNRQPRDFWTYIHRIISGSECGEKDFEYIFLIFSDYLYLMRIIYTWHGRWVFKFFIFSKTGFFCKFKTCKFFKIIFKNTGNSKYQKVYNNYFFQFKKYMNRNYLTEERVFCIQ